LLSRGQGLRRVVGAAQYAAGCAAGCLAVAAIQWHFNGSPFASGYGELDTLFASSHVWPNVQRYSAWLVRAESPVIVLAVAAPFVWRDARAWLYLAVAAAVIALYLPYLVFDDWAFLRFLLPALPVLVVLTLTVVASAGRRLGPRLGPWLLPAVAVLLVAHSIRVAGAQHVFELGQLESSYRRVGEAMASRLPQNALVITSLHSGSVRFYAGRRTVVWDVLDGGSLDAVVAFAARKGLAPYLLIGSGEEAAFRTRFAASRLARLDWPPQVEVAPQIRLYVPAARERYLRGESMPTEFVP
jgi:hypothetical protein